MEVTKFDAVMFVYNYAAVVSGGLLVLTIGIQDRFVLFATAFVVATVWTIYFKFDMLPRQEETLRET